VFAAGISLVAQTHDNVVVAQVWNRKRKMTKVAPKYTIMANQLESAMGIVQSRGRNNVMQTEVQ
jgi:hypothetical protein